MNVNITCVIVTYNRIEKLKKCLASYEQQIFKPKKVIVVDNGSNQETKDFLKNWSLSFNGFEKIVLTLDSNYGGSGGFYYGLKKAKELGFDWVWIADDDAYPEKDAFLKLKDYILTHDVNVVCSSVYENNKIANAHRRILINNKFKTKEIPIDNEKYDCEFKFNIFSFVGTAFTFKVLEKCGLPNKDFFIWFDDSEYSRRVNDFFEIVCVPGIKVLHDVDGFTQSGLSWKTYYGFRNQFYMHKKHDTKMQFFCFLIHQKLYMMKCFFLDKRRYRVLKDGYNDFRKGKMGISEKYHPGTKI